MVLQSFLFLDDSDSTGESNPLVCTGGKQLALYVSSDGADPIDLNVLGQIDLDGYYESIGVIKASDFSTASYISDEGIYLVPVNGITRVKIENNETPGSVKVFGNLTD